MSRVYVLYDDRAANGLGTDNASVLEVCESNAEACRAKGNYGAMACYSYRQEGSELVDECFEWNWYPGR